ncbi:unnamed protein product [Notodromas monacha]|uniref:DnaJ homolog subfamily C member 16 n=1 Tax=Notodromas monacha TaxID=399045 RepID=A0A7R9BEA0_9CRUS|nr:unnamed protein product [Notodromas monacha]CAG0913740.1 unnamed protein product [Notodromas monacha]
MRLLASFIGVAVFVVVSCSERFDPYHVLGVNRRADMSEVRRSYKQLAKKWHPDKSSDPEAQAKFIELNKAYDILSDPERRKKFDDFGIYEDQPNFSKQPDYSQFGRFDFFDDIMSQFHNGPKFNFHFGKPEMDFYKKMTVSGKQYFNSILPNSRTKPTLIIFFSDWCRVCQQIEPIWRKVEEDMTFSGIEVAAMHVGFETELVKQLGVNEASILFVVDGRTWKYRENLISSMSIAKFVRSKIPSNVYTSLTSESLDEFLDGWRTDNKPRAVIVGQSDKVRLRYLVTCLAMNNWFKFGYVRSGSEEAERLLQKADFFVRPRMDAVLVFNENSKRPIASISMQEIPVTALKEVLNNHKFLILPRQAVFDAVCPPEKSRYRKRLCVILVTSDSPEHDIYRDSLRSFVSSSSAPSSDRVRFLYVFPERQPEFMQAVTKMGDDAPVAPDLHIVILWRQDDRKVKFEWVDAVWEPGNNESKEALEKATKRLLREDEMLMHEAVMQQLLDEHARGIFEKIAEKIHNIWETIVENASKEDVLPAVSVLGTIVFILFVGWFMSYMVKLEDEKIAKTQSAAKLRTEPQLKIHELRGETYNGLVRLLKPGCRTIILILDNDSKRTLLPKFHRVVWPYRKNKSLLYAFLHVERGLEWFKRILLLAIPELEERNLRINPKNVVGTVLSLNGHRKYFCMYHAKHRDQTGNSNNAFVGFDEEEDDSEREMDVERAGVGENENPLLDQYDSDVLFLEHLLDGLPNWLDRLFEGSAQRYHLNYWPDYIGK